MKSKVIYINPSILIRYREYDRTVEKVPQIWGLYVTDYDKLKESIKINGITNPLELIVYKNKALLSNGNNRLAIALELGMNSVPVIVRKNIYIYTELSITRG
jgi:ParB-like chromosome segregation protein Spo0J